MLINKLRSSAIIICFFYTLCLMAESTPIMLSELALTPNFIGTKVSIIRSNTSELPESINREAYATIDRARDALIALQGNDGYWETDKGEKTILPAFALLDGAKPSPFYSNQFYCATKAAQKWINKNASKPWSTYEIKEASIALNLLAITGEPGTVPLVAIEHLKNISTKSLNELDPIGKYFLILALAQHNELSQESFDTIIREQSQIKESELLPICMIGISRLMRSQSEIPPNDAKAYLRFLANRLQLGYHNLSPGEEEVLFPQLGFLTMIFASSFTNRQLALDKTLFPYDWRNHLANRIIASQIYCPETGAPYWRGEFKKDSRTSYNSLEATTLAIITLSNLAN